MLLEILFCFLSKIHALIMFLRISDETSVVTSKSTCKQFTELQYRIIELALSQKLIFVLVTLIYTCNGIKCVKQILTVI